MNTRSSMRILVSGALGLGTCLAACSAQAQSAAQLDIATHAGLTVTGSVGTVYSIDCVTDLAETNRPGAWCCLEYLQLPATPFLWVDRSAPVSNRRFYRAVAAEAPASMVFVPPGTFRMGSPTGEVDRYPFEGPPTAVFISQGFWIGSREVTQGEYLAVLGNNPSYFQPPNTPVDLNRPVEQVSWDDAVAYCVKLTERERAAGRIATNAVYRLPWEAEWEYACRAWTSTRFGFGDDPGYMDLGRYAWYGANGGRATHPVGQKLPNAWGLHDMHGNVWEWCQDWWSDSYPGGTVLDPRGPATGAYRVIRGGYWFAGAKECRSAHRSDRDTDSRFPGIGFRVVLAIDQP